MESNKTAEIIQMMEQGVKDVFTSDRFKDYLSFCSRFYQYSFGNTILILMQMPKATYVAGYNSWLKMNRFVNKGEHGIRILAPCIKKSTVTDENGIESVIYSANYFRSVTVFDISQTSGEDVPTICDELNGQIEDADDIVGKIASASDYPVEYGDTGTAYGYFSNLEKRIVLKNGLADTQRIKTLTHEVAHSLLWEKDEEQKADRADREIEAEATAYIVCSRLGIDTSSYSFEYIASWSHDQDVKALKRLLGNIQSAAQTILDKVCA